MVKKTLVCICLLLSVAVAASAASPLTADQVERVLNTLDKLDPIMEQMESEMEQMGDDNADPFDPEMMNRECAMIYGYSPQAQKIIEASGFTYKTWPETAGRVMRALTSIAMEQDADTGMDEMKQALAEIEANPDITPEQKTMMKQHMQSALQTAKAMMQAPEADIAVVRPFYDKYAAETE